MTSTIQTLITIIGAVAGAGSLIIFFIFYNLNKRIKKNEADRSEIDNLKSIIDVMRNDRDGLLHRVEKLEKRDLEREKMLVDIERDNNIYKRAGNAGNLCNVPRENCPIHVKFYELKNAKDDNL